MTGPQLLAARKHHRWTQVRTCVALRVSQPYLSLMEKGLRSVPNHVAKRAAKAWKLSPELLPLNTLNESDDLPRTLGSLGYPGFAYLKGKQQNPASLLMRALSQHDLESRVVEALPWPVMNHPRMDWDWLLQQSKLNETQNRLGYLTDLAARKTLSHTSRDQLSEQQGRLERVRLAREDTLCHESMTQVERAWLRERRPAEATHWNLLTDLTVEQLVYE